MNRHKHYPPEVRERAVRLVLEHQENYHSQWAALTSIADKIGCTAETLRKLRISQQSCHPLHGKAATHFTRKLPPITRQSCHL